MFHNFKDRSSPLLQAAGARVWPPCPAWAYWGLLSASGAPLHAARGHFELVQLILETAVMTEGPERAKRLCIDHANTKRQTPLMVACKHG